MKTPERIVICNHREHGPMWFAKQPDMPVVFFGDAVTDEYIRIDLYEQLQAEVESYKTKDAEYQQLKAAVEEMIGDKIEYTK